MQLQTLLEYRNINTKLIDILKSKGYQGPFRVGDLPSQWQATLKDIEGSDDSFQAMIQGDDPEYGGWVLKIPSVYGPYAFGAESGYNVGTPKDILKTLDESDLEEKASRKLCVSSATDAELGASNLASCKSQGLRARDGKKSHLIGKSRKSVGGKKIKGKRYGGPLPDWS